MNAEVRFSKIDESGASEIDPTGSDPMPSPNSQPSADSPPKQRPHKNIELPFLVLGAVLIAFCVIAAVLEAHSGSSSSAYDVGVFEGTVMARADINERLTDQVSIAITNIHSSAARTTYLATRTIGFVAASMAMNMSTPLRVLPVGLTTWTRAPALGPTSHRHKRHSGSSAVSTPGATAAQLVTLAIQSATRQPLRHRRRHLQLNRPSCLQ